MPNDPNFFRRAEKAVLWVIWWLHSRIWWNHNQPVVSEKENKILNYFVFRFVLNQQSGENNGRDSGPRTHYRNTQHTKQGNPH